MRASARLRRERALRDYAGGNVGTGGGKVNAVSPGKNTRGEHPGKTPGKNTGRGHDCRREATPSGEFSQVAREARSVVSAQHQAGAVCQDDREISVEQGLHLSDPVDVHDCRAVYAEELGGVDA